MFQVKFWGVRGSVPTPLTPAQVQAKVAGALAWVKEHGIDPRDPIPFELCSTFGGNTTCVEVNSGDELFILDLGTGVRELGIAQMPEIMKTKRLHGTILQSHVHWDHIQGLPFWKPLYLPRRTFDCGFKFFGGKTWDSPLNEVYQGQMGPPVFPVNLEELAQSAMAMEFNSIWDGWEQEFRKLTMDLEIRTGLLTNVVARKLNHPQETFGYRLTQVNTLDDPRTSKVLTFTTDHEPYAAGLPKPLLELVNKADVWITDCQYSHDEYIGKIGPQKQGWGHSYPEYIAAVAKEAQPKKIVTTHHEPETSDAQIIKLAQQVQELSGIETVPAYEGLRLEL